MKMTHSILIVCLAALATPCLHATTDDKSDKPQPAALNLTVPPGSSSSGVSDLPEEPSLAVLASGGTPAESKSKFRPFSAVAVALKFGGGGIGFDVAVPLARRLNLRGGFSYFSVSPSISEDGITVNGTITFKTAAASLDFFPIGKFRISPGLILYNGNHLTANASVAGGAGFTLGSYGYTSSVANPVTGTFDMAFGNKVAPSFTVGTGNMLPGKKGQHWSVPFEVGFEYIGPPAITLNLTGSTCTNGQNNCQPVNQSSVAQEQADLTSDISGLRFYPIMSIGVSYKFGK